MNITVNQNRQLYVAMRYADGTTVPAVDESSKVGDIQVKVTDPQKTGDIEKEMYFTYKGAASVLKSDRIQLKNLGYAKAVAASDMLVPLKKVKVELDPNVNGGNPIAGRDYTLNIHLPGFYLDTEIEDYYKYGAVHATAAMAADKKEFYKAMVKSLNANFSREVDATATSNPYLEFSAGTAGSEDGIYITEKEQGWTLGIEAQRRIVFEVEPTTVYDGTDDVIWAKQDANTGKYYQDLTPAKGSATAGVNAIGNGKKIADLEYFCMGERGDQYRMMGWPNVIKTDYLIDPTKEYHTLEIHYAFTDTGVNSYRSEKDITIVSDDKAVINSIISEINTEAGLNIATLP